MTAYVIFLRVRFLLMRELSACACTFALRSGDVVEDGSAVAGVAEGVGVELGVAEVDEVEVNGAEFGAAQVGAAEVGFADFLGAFVAAIFEIVVVEAGHVSFEGDGAAHQSAA